ncbi:hypothetical protein M0R45_000723 [Rubus argutus]|uniref:Major facilitator superfamily (MFS) profile domain-containing protein n=1 Tax=Rubus argutus TaxID=59490 RepID=A0AAW1VK14_RUBAR
MKMKSETVTLVLVNLASIMQRADESLLPGVYKEVGASLHTDPTGLGSLTLFRSIVQSSCYPLAAYLAMRHNRAHVIALGAFLWAAATFLVGFSSTFLQVAISRGLNGIGLAIVIPAIQSLVADSTDESNRGTAFGWLQLTGNLGSIIGGLCSVLIASTSVMGIAGWRIAFHLVGLISVIVGILVRLFANDPHYVENNFRAKDQMPRTFSEEVKDLIKESKSVIKIPTFQILIAQGVFGSFPWSDKCRISHSFAALLLLGLPDDPSTGFMHGLVLFIMGWFTSWNAPATNNPIFAEIVPERSRTSIYALDQSFESILSSFAPPIVGILVQHVFGYKPIPKGSSDSVEIETDRENAASLAKALFTTMAIPMTLCVSIYSFLYCTYPRDKERARMQALIESEMQQLETSCAASGEEYSQLPVSELKGLNGKDRSDIDIEYAAHESIELDDNDEKSLLSHQLTFSNMKE